jgi:Holliday junction DNA helicase RuvB
VNIDHALRPQTFDQYIGQPSLIARLRILVGAAKSRNEPMPHTLLCGPPGLGKTTLAYILANEMGAIAHVIMGPAMEKPADVTAVLTKLGAGDILFIDECHRIPPATGELLYPAMEDFRMTIALDCGAYVRHIPVDVPPFTLIGATTQPGLLEPPLRDRFGLPLALEHYNAVDLATILKANAIKLGIACESAALVLLACRSRGTPRIANHLLKFCRDYAAVECRGNGTHITVGMVEAALRMQGIDALGLNESDRTYLKILSGVYNGGPAGVEALAATMGLKSDTVASVIEPFLLAAGLIVRTQRGRRTTEAAARHLAALAA